MSDCLYEKNYLYNPESKGCKTVTYQSATLSVPVTVKPKVSAGDINTFCCGDPVVTPSPYKIICNSKHGSCTFTITQNICVEIPIEFSASAFMACPRVECGEVTNEMCENCGR